MSKALRVLIAVAFVLSISACGASPRKGLCERNGGVWKDGRCSIQSE